MLTASISCVEKLKSVIVIVINLHKNRVLENAVNYAFTLSRYLFRLMNKNMRGISKVKYSAIYLITYNPDSTQLPKDVQGTFLGHMDVLRMSLTFRIQSGSMRPEQIFVLSCDTIS